MTFCLEQLVNFIECGEQGIQFKKIFPLLFFSLCMKCGLVMSNIHFIVDLNFVRICGPHCACFSMLFSNAFSFVYYFRCQLQKIIDEQKTRIRKTERALQVAEV